MSHPPPAHDDPGSVPQLDIVLPVHNEARQLAASVTALRTFLDRSFPLTTVVTVVDNASTDDTWTIAAGLAGSLPGVRAIHLDQKGRGRALRAAWTASRSPVVGYMDIDLATGLEALLPLVAPLLTGHSDVAIGTRLAPGAHVVRGARREIISRSYNLLLRIALANSCSDAQCGFKALRREAVDALLPLVDDQAWFFDTEVLIAAQRLGLRIHEVPVDWVDDLDSRVAVTRTAWLDLCGVARMMTPASRRRTARVRRALASGPVPPESAPTPVAVVSERREIVDQGSAGSEVFADELIRFAGVGLVSTLAYIVLFAILVPWIGAYAANAVAIVACSLGNTAAHRGVAGTARHGLDRPHRLSVGAALLGVSLAFTTAALAVTRTFGLDGLVPELVAVTLANLAAAAFRFTILRTWVFRPHFGTHVRPVALDHADHGGTGPARPTVPTGSSTQRTPPIPSDSSVPSTPSTTDRIPTRTSR
jgi:putative flippase GtrA